MTTRTRALLVALVATATTGAVFATPAIVAGLTFRTLE
jgi:hypothetical protein